jgi:hypothetical protein
MSEVISGCKPSPYPSPACGRGKLPLRVSEGMAAGEGVKKDYISA